MSFFQVSYPGCLALLSGGTACQVGQVGCPTQITTGGGSTTTTPTGAAGWTSTMTSTELATLCNTNDYTGAGANSVEFDFSL